MHGSAALAPATAERAFRSALGRFATGVTLITDKPKSGVDSKDTTFGMDACWGAK